MLQTCDGFAFGAKACQICLSRVTAAQDHLQGDDAIQRCLTCLINDAHAAASEFALDDIAGNSNSLAITLG